MPVPTSHELVHLGHAMHDPKCRRFAQETTQDTTHHELKHDASKDLPNRSPKHTPRQESNLCKNRVSNLLGFSWVAF